jgi:hypothetical protein
MCTVTYLPLHREGFVLTSTRDERTIRKPALPPEPYEVHESRLIYPKDPEGRGTWIASSMDEYSLCLLNGGFYPHESKPPYRMSRGLVIPDFFEYGTPERFRNIFDFKGIEPFTLLIIGYEARSLDELRWDGEQIHHKELNPELPGIWSSVTLYPEEVIRMRRGWFENWLLKKPPFHINSAVSFHKKAGTGDSENDILMNRDNLIRTVSITSIFRSESVHEMYYEDIISGEICHLSNLDDNRFIVL